MLYSIVGMLVIILDQAFKFWVSNNLFGTDIVKFIPGVISLVNVHNDGAAFSFLSGSGARIYFIVVTGVFAVLVVIALATNFISTPVARWSLVLVTAGGLGNMIDRIMYGYVQDMFKVELFNFAIFNVADIFITVFAIVFVLAMFLEKPSDDDDWEDDEEEEEPEEEIEEKPRKSRKARKKALAEEELPIPAAKKSRQEKLDREQESNRPKQRTAKNPRPDAAVRPAVSEPEEDPFAAWEKANANVDAERSTSYASRAMGAEAPRRPVQRPVQRPVEAEKKPVERPVIKNAEQPVVRKAPQAAPAAPVQRPVQPSARPVQRPAEKPASPEAPIAGKDFDLDDILAEFK